LYETTDRYGRILPLLGTPASSAEFIDTDTPREFIPFDPVNGTTEVWRVYNNTVDAHPIHLHQTAFQILTRNTFTSKLVNLGVDPVSGVTNWSMGRVVTRTLPLLAAGNEVAWKDTFQILPGEVVTLQAKFDLPGKYVLHCHILSHEEHDMMRYMQVGDAAYPAPGFVVGGTGAVVAPAPVIAGVVDLGATAPATLFSGVAITPAVKDEEIPSIVDQVLA
jgi:spore coat protein A, manganese oxidase